MALSLFSRAEFRSKKFEHRIPVPAHQVETWMWEIPASLAFCLENVTWRYAVNHSDPKTFENGYGWPKTPLKVTIEPLLSAEVSPPDKLQPPKVFTGKVPVVVENPSDIPVTLILKLEGILVAKTGTEDVLESEILGYAMLEPSQRGMLAISQASIENKTVNAFQTSPQNALPANSPTLALPEISSDECLSLMIGDIVRAKTTEVEPLAEFLISRGWRRESR